MTDKIFVQTTCASAEEAGKICRHLVDLRLAACASFSSPVHSIYRWQGAVEEADEFIVTVKTRRDLYERVMAEVRRVHSYDLPEILAIPVVSGSEEYLEWMDRELAQ